METPLIRAAREGQASEVKQLLAAGADPNLFDKGSMDYGMFFVNVTPLMVAAASRRSNSETVAALLEGGADIGIVSAGGVTALWYAAGGATGWHCTEEEFAELPIDHPFRDWGGGDAGRLRLLLDAGGDANETADNGRSTVAEACSIGDPIRLKLLIEHGGSVWPRPPRDKFRSPVNPLVMGILEHASGLTEENLFEFESVPLFNAAESGSAECVRLVLEQGFPADYKSRSQSALHHARSVEVVRVLWDAGLRPEPGAFGYDPVDEAFENEQYDIAAFFLDRVEAGGLQSYLDQKLFECSGVRMNPTAVRLLLARGARVDSAPSWSGGPLHYACWQGDGNGGRETSVVREVVGILIEAGADVNARDQEGATPLHEATYGDWGSPTAVEVLIQNGAQLDLQDRAGRTPLMLAADRGEIACLRLLLGAGANASLKDKKRRTAVDYAVDHLKIWRKIAKRPPKIVGRTLAAFGATTSVDDRRAHYQEVLQNAVECVRLLEAETGRTVH
jgi:ankyrin repeat protein